MKPDMPEWIAGSVIIAFISASVGNFFGGKGKITKATCDERRNACNNLMQEKIDRVYDRVESMDEKIDILIIHKVDK